MTVDELIEKLLEIRDKHGAGSAEVFNAVHDDDDGVIMTNYDLKPKETERAILSKDKDKLFICYELYY